MAKVSVIIPVYNVEAYLEECLNSVIRQTLRELEIICINDGSTDHSLDILRKYAAKDARISIIDKENGGYGVAMNLGLQQATGEYIGIVEPDDYIALTMYEDLYATAAGYQLDFVKADFYRFTRNANGDMKLIYNRLSNDKKDYRVLFNPGHTPRTLRYIMNTWSGIYRREFLEQFHIRHNETPGASFQDNGFYFQTFVYASRAMILDVPYYRNRRDNPNSSVNNPDKVYCINAEYDYIREILMRDRAVWERFRGMYWLKKYTNYRANLRRIGEQYRKEYLFRFAAELKRGMDQREIEKTLFTKTEWQDIEDIMNNPEAYYRTRIRNVKLTALPTEEEKLEKELQEIKKSESYRLGKAILSVPRKIKQWIKKK